MNSIFERIVSSINYVDFNAEYETLGINLDECRNKKTGKIYVSEDVQAVIVAKQLIKSIETSGFFVAKQNSIILFYFGKHWSSINDSEWSEFIMNASSKMRSDISLFVTFRFQKLLIQTIKMYLPAFENADEIEKNKLVKINCNNGTLLINNDGNIQLTSHNPEDFFRYCLDYNYSPNADISLFKQYLNRILPDVESQLLLQEFFGAVLAKDLKLEFIGILLGQGSNGKSVLHSIMLALFGRYNVSTLSWSQLMHETSRVDLDGKLLNYSSEIDSGSLSGSADVIKLLASKEPIYVRRYYQQSYQMIDYGRLLINANNMPPLIEYSHAFLRRIKIIVFDQKIDGSYVDMMLSEKIISKELSGILNWVIIGCQRIMANHRFTESPKSQSALKQYIKEQSPVNSFIEEFSYIPSIDGQKVKFQTFYNEFILYCRENKLKIVNSHEFGRILRQMNFEIKKGAQNKSFVFAAKIFCDEDG